MRTTLGDLQILLLFHKHFAATRLGILTHLNRIFMPADLWLNYLSRDICDQAVFPKLSPFSTELPKKESPP